MSRVAVLGGGRSSEHEVSIASAASVAEGLREAGHDVVEIRVEKDGTWRWTSGGAAGDAVSVVPGQGIDGVDLVFPVLHGPFGEDGTVQGLLECLGVPYVGAGVLASALCMDKVVFKELMAQAGLPQVAYVAVRAGEFASDGPAVLASVGTLGLPVFVKPARLGSSVGISRVAAAEELEGALREAFRFDPLVIVEAAASGLEVECSVIGGGDGVDDAVASEPGEIVLTGAAAGGGGWYDYEAKYTPGGMELVVPARISAVARERVRALAVETFVRSGCSGLARVDFFVDGDHVLVNELNTMPGFTATSVFGALFAASGVPYPELLDRLVGIARARFDAAQQVSY